MAKHKKIERRREIERRRRRREKRLKARAKALREQLLGRLEAPTQQAKQSTQAG